MNIPGEINAVVKQKKITPKIPDLNDKSDSDATRNIGIDVDDGSFSGLVSPVIFTALTYDDTKDVTILDTVGTEHTIKTVATAQIEDANGTIIEIEEVIFTEPPPP